MIKYVNELCLTTSFTYPDLRFRWKLMVDGGSAAIHALRPCFQVCKYDTESTSLSQIKLLHALIVALHQVT